MGEAAKICWVVELGLIAYAPACELQRRLVEARKAGTIQDVLLFCEHPHVITLGRNARSENLLASNQLLAQQGVELATTDRGGDITYHGPGQIVGYPILDLTEHRRDVRWYVEQLVETMIRATGDFGVSARRSESGHGTWIDTLAQRGAEKEQSSTSGAEAHNEEALLTPQLKPRPTRLPDFPANHAAGEEKLAAVGVHLSRWVTSHGFAYNVATDLRYFDLIVPCGIAGKRATSLERVLGRAVCAEVVRARLAERFGEVFEREMVCVTREELEETLELAGQQEEVGAVKGLEG